MNEQDEQADTDDTDDLDTQGHDDADTGDKQQDDADQADAGSDDAQGDDEGQGDQAGKVSFDGDSPPQEDSNPTIRQMRTALREKERRIADLERQQQPTQQQDQGPGPKPTLEGCEFDEAKYERDMAAWLDRDRQAKADTEARTASQQAFQRALGEKRTAYDRDKAGFDAKEFADNEAAVNTALPEWVRNMVVMKSKDPAALIHGLGQRPDKLKEIADLKDPADQVWVLAQLDKNMTATRKTSTKPETRPESAVRGDRPVGMKGDQTLAKLEAEAERTKDRTKVLAYKKAQQRRAG